MHTRLNYTIELRFWNERDYATITTSDIIVTWSVYNDTSLLRLFKIIVKFFFLNLKNIIM